MFGWLVLMTISSLRYIERACDRVGQFPLWWRGFLLFRSWYDAQEKWFLAFCLSLAKSVVPLSFSFSSHFSASGIIAGSWEFMVRQSNQHGEQPENKWQVCVVSKNSFAYCSVACSLVLSIASKVSHIRVKLTQSITVWCPMQFQLFLFLNSYP